MQNIDQRSKVESRETASGTPRKGSGTLTFRHLRFAKSTLVAHYLLPRPQLFHTWLWVTPRTRNRRTQLATDEVIYHSWLPGMLEVPKPAADLARELASGKATPETSERHRTVAEALIDLGWCQDVPIDIDALVVKTRDVFIALQNPRELSNLLHLVARQQPKTVVEIGTASGGLFYCLSQLADPAAKMISIDIEGGAYGGGQTAMETMLFSTFGPPTQKFHYLRQRTFHYNTMKSLEKILDGKPIDFLLIDGDHSYAGVKSDFYMYGKYMAPDGIIAMHDICDFPMHMKAWREGNDVNIFWQELKAKDYETQEFIDETPLLTAGDGSGGLQRRWPALGFGVVFGGAKPDSNWLDVSPEGKV